MMLSAIERLTPGCFYQFLLTRFGQCRFVQVGEQLSKLVGLPLTALMEDANSFFSLLNAECRQAVMQKLAESAARGAEFATCDKFIRPDNKVVWLETRSIPEVQANGDIIWTGFVYDVTSREQALYELNELASTSKAILDNLLDAVITIIPTGCIDFANQTALKLFGYNAEQLIGQNISCLMAGQHAKNHNDYLSHYMLTREARIIGAKRVVEAVDSEKNVIPVELRICELHSEKGLRFLGVIRDLRAKQQQQKQIEQLTHVDPLTGLPNRLALQRELNSLIDRQVLEQRDCCLICLDADDFRLINEGYGFEFGDDFLRRTAGILQRFGLPFIARTGEDEFALLIDFHGDLEQIRRLVLSIQQQLATPHLIQGLSIGGSFTAGVFVIEASDITFSEALHKAEIALHHARSSGKGGLAFYEQSVAGHRRHYAVLDQQLKSPRVTNDMQLVYQPQYNQHQQLIGFEALMRWQHQQQIISPDVFIPLAERNGAIYSMGRWLLQHACEFINNIDQRPALKGCRLSINISPKQFAARHFVQEVLQQVAQAGIEPARLHLELTERLLLENPIDVIQKMQALNAVGITFSLDDFGTGYSSLAYLKQLPLHELKIDKSFVRDLHASASDRSIVSAILLMASGLNLQVIAEGVETDSQLAVLQELGCRIYQGYLFSKPQSAAYWLQA